MKKLTAGIFATTLFFYAVSCSAATLSVPSKGPYSVGQTFSVPVEVSTAQDAPLNAVSGIISFPADNLRAVSVDKSGIINFWVHDPTISNSSGTISFEGVALNPGFVGSHGVVLTVTFKVLAAGTASLSFPSASILANDGAGTEILSKAQGTQISLTPQAPKATPAPVTHLPTLTPTQPTTPAAPSTPVVATTTQPILSCATTTTPAIYSNAPVLVPIGAIDEGGMVKILGTSYPSAQVNVFIHGEKGVTYSQTVQTNQYGSFELIWSQSIPSGIYSVTAEVIDPHGLRSPSSPETFFQIKESAATMIGHLVLSNQFFFIIFTLLGLSALVFFFGWHAGFIAITMEPEEQLPAGQALTGLPSATHRIRVRLTGKHRRILGLHPVKHPRTRVKAAQ